MNVEVIEELNEMINNNLYDVNKLNTYYDLIMPHLRQNHVTETHQIIAKKIGGCFCSMPRYQFFGTFDIEPEQTSCCFGPRNKYSNATYIEKTLSKMAKTEECDLLVMMECLGYIKNHYDATLMALLIACFNSI